MLRFKLNAPYEQVYVCISLENPSTGQKLTIDAKELELIGDDAMLLT